MNKLQRETIKGRLIRLATFKSTGTPSDLAERFEIGVRSVKRIVKEIRAEGVNLKYNRFRGTYEIE